jgi:hypothetical protein
LNHFETLKLAKGGVELNQGIDVIFRYKEAHSAVILFIMLFIHDLLQLILEGSIVKINVGEVRAISNEILKLAMVVHLRVIYVREVSLCKV